MRKLILDTGALVALLDISETHHARCLAFFRDFRGMLYTTEPVLTETLYLIGSSARARKACIEFMVAGGATLVPQSSASLARALVLMEKYRDIPMDFADATLVTLAEDIDTTEVFTLDIRGFSSYRIHRTRTFNIYPDLNP